LNLPFEVRIGLRYTRAGRTARRRNAFISFISGISMAGIALGVAALIVVLSVMNGFQKEVRDRMLSVLSHIEVFSYDGALTDWRRVAQQARAHPEVLAAAPYVSAQAMFTSADVVRGALVRGIDPALEPTVSDVVSSLKGGKLNNLVEGEFGVILGIDLARALSVGPGDKVTMIAPQGTVTPAGIVPRLRQFRVIATFESGHYEFDSTLALIHIGDAERLFRVEGPIGVRLKIKDMQQAPRVAAQLAGLLDPGLAVRDWSRQNRTWFAAVQTEKRMMFIILALIILVAAINIISTMVMAVTDKQADIAILRTLGASPRSVMQIFMTQGMVIGLVGTLVGVVTGIVIAQNIDVIVPFIERAFSIQFLSKDVYLIPDLPSDLQAGDVLAVSLMAIALSFLATVFPSLWAARVNPAEALRYE